MVAQRNGVHGQGRSRAADAAAADDADHVPGLSRLCATPAASDVAKQQLQSFHGACSGEFSLKQLIVFVWLIQVL
jgi:hypothetical protein